jgi:hypothetical protein
MLPPLGPLHLLRLTEALADDLVDGRLDKTGADVLSIAVALTIVALVIGVEFFDGPQELSCRVIIRSGHSSVNSAPLYLA